HHSVPVEQDLDAVLAGDGPDRRARDLAHEPGDVVHVRDRVDPHLIGQVVVLDEAVERELQLAVVLGVRPVLEEEGDDPAARLADGARGAAGLLEGELHRSATPFRRNEVLAPRRQGRGDEDEGHGERQPAHRRSVGSIAP
ncbi:MAG: hypothetical protein ACK55I_16010, partial [bacterium]